MTENNFLDKDGLSKYTSKLINKLDNKYLSKDNLNNPLSYDDNLIKLKYDESQFLIKKDENGRETGELTLNPNGVKEIIKTPTSKYYYYLGSSLENINGDSNWKGNINEAKINFENYNNLTFLGDTNNMVPKIGTGQNNLINSETLNSNNSCSFIFKNYLHPINVLIENIYFEDVTHRKIIINSVSDKESQNYEYIKYTITNLGRSTYLLNFEGLGINPNNPVTIDETEPELPEVNE